MYISVRDAAASSPGRTAGKRVATTVVLLGLVSLFTDVSSEMITAVLPLYLTTEVGLSFLAYGFVDGAYQGTSAFMRIAAGYVSDRWGRPKWAAALGYGISALSRIALLPAHSMPTITGVIVADRLGKGMRTAPRDKLIADASDPDQLGRAFGVHRALDTAGAAVGPVVAFALLAVAPGDFHSVFVVSFAFALVGLAVLLLFVPNRHTVTSAVATRFTQVMASLRGRDLRRPLLAAGLLGLFTVGDGFLYLAVAKHAEYNAVSFPLLVVGTNVAYLLLAIPFGRLADRIGRAKVFLGGHVALLGAYVAAAGWLDGTAATIACLALLGTFYAATDGVLAALVSRLVPEESRGTGIAAAQTVVVVARFGASVGFGALWTALGQQEALFLAASVLVLTIPVAGWLLLGRRRAEATVEG